MEEAVRAFVSYSALFIEAAAAIIVTTACLLATYSSLTAFFRKHGPLDVRIKLGRWLVLSLEFLLAADILRTAIAPTWEEIGQLGAIIVIRTVLNFFLEREIKAGHGREATANEAPPKGL